MAHSEVTIATATRDSWAPMIGLFLAQASMSFNVAAPRYRPDEIPDPARSNRR